MFKKNFVILLIVFLAFFVRLYRIETNSHFLRDESRDLLNIHRIYENKKITLVGPISDNESHVFSSLTYYLYLPIAIMLNFSVKSTVIGAIFWGIITFLSLWFLAIKINSKLFIWAGILGAVFWPLVETSRWPWNPNFLVFWLTLSLIFQLDKKKISQFLSGIMSGFSLHHHFLSIMAIFLIWIKKRKLLFLLGLFLVFLPFIIFDLRHPPGLFLSKFLSYNKGVGLPSIIGIYHKYVDGIIITWNYFFGKSFFSYILSVIFFFVLANDIKEKNKNLYWLGASFISLGVFIFYSEQTHYVLPIIPFFWLWIFGERKKKGDKLIKIFILGATIISLSIFWQKVNVNTCRGNLKLIQGASNIIEREIKKQELVNANVVVLQIPDELCETKIYRNILEVKNISIKRVEEYNVSDNLFVITQSDEKTLKKDPAYEIDNFRNGIVVGEWEIEETDYKVFQFNKY